MNHIIVDLCQYVRMRNEISAFHDFFKLFLQHDKVLLVFQELKFKISEKPDQK